MYDKLTKNDIQKMQEEINHRKLVVRLAHQERPTAGSTLWLHLAENQLHLFDGETGQRV